MIFVAVGTQKFPFNRLLKGIDDLIEQGQLEEEVFAQIGHSDYVPRNYGYQDFLTKEDFQNYISNCDVLITHSGVATIIAGMKLEKPVVVVPRFASYGEHVDDHQLQKPPQEVLLTPVDLRQKMHILQGTVSGLAAVFCYVNCIVLIGNGLEAHQFFPMAAGGGNKACFHGECLLSD